MTDWLRSEGFQDNHKRIERVYREEKLQVRRRKRKRLAPGTERKPVPIPGGPRERWSIDFVHDVLATGRRMQALTIVDDFSRESPAIEVDFSLGAAVTGTIRTGFAIARPVCVSPETHPHPST